MAWSGGHISWTNFICTKKKRGIAITHKDNKACCDQCWLFLSDGRWHDLERWYDPLVITLHLWKMYDCGSQNSETRFWSVTAVLKQSKNQSNDLQNYWFWLVTSWKPPVLLRLFGRTRTAGCLILKIFKKLEPRCDLILNVLEKLKLEFLWFPNFLKQNWRLLKKNRYPPNTG
jgi:hypothetical protein